MRNFRELKVWQRAHRLTLHVYAVTRRFPKEERFGVIAQVRRSVASIPANIAEGCGRSTQREVARFMVVATGSASETEYLLLLAKDLGYLDGCRYRKINEEINEVKRMLFRFTGYLRAHEP